MVSLRHVYRHKAGVGLLTNEILTRDLEAIQNRCVVYTSGQQILAAVDAPPANGALVAVVQCDWPDTPEDRKPGAGAGAGAGGSGASALAGGGKFTQVVDATVDIVTAIGTPKQVLHLQGGDSAPGAVMIVTHTNECVNALNAGLGARVAGHALDPNTFYPGLKYTVNVPAGRVANGDTFLLVGADIVSVVGGRVRPELLDMPKGGISASARHPLQVPPYRKDKPKAERVLLRLFVQWLDGGPRFVPSDQPEVFLVRTCNATLQYADNSLCAVPWQKVGLGYAGTKFKAQGGQGDTTLVVVPPASSFNADARELYVGVSRAKSRVIVIAGQYPSSSSSGSDSILSPRSSLARLLTTPLKTRPDVLVHTLGTWMRAADKPAPRDVTPAAAFTPFKVFDPIKEAEQEAREVAAAAEARSKWWRLRERRTQARADAHEHKAAFDEQPRTSLKTDPGV